MTRIPNSIAERTDKIHASDFKSKFICNVKVYAVSPLSPANLLNPYLELVIGCSSGHLVTLGSTRNNLLHQLKDKPYIEGGHTCQICTEHYTIRLYTPA